MKSLANHVVRDHVVLGGAFACLLFPFWGWKGSLLFWLANIFIDMDHYLHFLCASPARGTGVRSMFLFHQGIFEKVHRADFLAIEIFHTFEFMTILGFFSFFIWPSLQPIFYGAAFHILVDYFHLARLGIFSKRANSILEYWLRRRNLVKKSIENEPERNVTR